MAKPFKFIVRVLATLVVIPLCIILGLVVGGLYALALPVYFLDLVISSIWGVPEPNYTDYEDVQ